MQSYRWPCLGSEDFNNAIRNSHDNAVIVIYCG